MLLVALISDFVMTIEFVGQSYPVHQKSNAKHHGDPRFVAKKTKLVIEALDHLTIVTNPK